ncbi:MAG TPA: ABC transporter substrate-binding protein [Methylomirabilota bacterium]|nr:ABC transporter substrate-binding protein [Methylomirabilota bacterium]
MDDASTEGAVPALGRRRFVAICAGAVAGAAIPGRAHARPVRGGVLKHIGLDPSTFDIHAPGSEEAQLVSSFVRRTLFKFVNGARHGPSDFALVPDLALGATASADGKTYTVVLRQDARWESRPPVDGREVVASDVKYSLERALRKSPHASLLGPVEGIETPDRHTVRVHLAEAFAPFLHRLAEPWTAVLPPEVEDRMGALRGAESLVGCGPFVLERYEPGVKLVFARNPGYYARGLPYLDKVEWLCLKDRATHLSLFRAGQVDIPFQDARIPRTDVASLRKMSPAYPIVYWDGLAVRTLAMRTDKPPFSDVRVRRALSLAVDRKKWAARYAEGRGDEDGGPLPAAMRGWKLSRRELGEGARYLEHDPSMARKLLAVAGFPAGLKLKCSNCPGYGPEYVDDLEMLALDLRQIGIELHIVNEDHAQYVRGSRLGKFDEMSWGPSSSFTEVDGYLYGFFHSGEPDNRSHVADAGLDAMLEAQRRVTSRSARKPIVDDIQRRAAAQVYYVYTPYPKNVAAWAPRVRNYAPKNSLDRGAQLEVVWLDGA